MEQIEYTRTVVPSSMRSPYWKYFGFPSDNGNNILTRQKIVCTICNTAIAYNKNTSNLRTHLMSKHIEIFQKLIKTSNTTIDSNQEITVNQCVETERGIRHESGTIADPANVFNINVIDNKRRRSESNNEVSVCLQSKNNFLGDFLTIAKYSTSLQNNNHKLNTNGLENNKVDIELQSANYIGLMPSNDSEIVEVSEVSDEDLTNNTNVFDSKNEQTFSYDDVILPEQHEQQSHSMDIMLADMIQTDLLSLDMLENYGFCKYNQQLTGLKIDDYTVKRVKDVIEKRYTNTKELITTHVNRLSQNSPYSLSIEVYKDKDNQDILNIYYNYLNDDQISLISILYESTCIYTKAINISELLMEINLKNCSCVVVPSRDNLYDFVLDFINCHELPLIECLESMLTRCLETIFGANEFSDDYSKFFKIINKYPTDTNKSIPKPRCLWSKLNFIEYTFMNIVHVEQDDIEEWKDMKRIFEYIKPLKMALEIISDEHLPLCTLTRPLIIKLFEEHFSITHKEESTKIFNIHKILEKELHERTMAQSFLNEATFFDTRFHSDFALQESVIEISYLKSQVLKRFKNILEVACINKTYNIKDEQNFADPLTNYRKCSSLKSFFKRDTSMTPTNEVNVQLKTNLDLEFEQYQTEACLDLDQSPALWWQQRSDKYKQLSKVAKFYLAIPCCCLPRLCRLNLEQRCLKMERRKNLSQLSSGESKLWYLYYNDDVVELI